MSEGHLFDYFFEDRTNVVSKCDLKDVHIEVTHDEIRKFDSITGYPVWRKVKSKSITMVGIKGDQTIRINITGDFNVMVKGDEVEII